RLTGTPAGLHALHVRNDGLRFLRWRSRIGLGLRLRPLTRMDDDKAQARLRHAPLTVLHLHLAPHAFALPAARHFALRPPRLLDQEGQSRLLAPPRFTLLPDSPGTRHQGHEAHTAFEAQPSCPATVRFTIRHDPTHPVQAQSQALLNGKRGFHTVAAVAISYADPEGQPTLATAPKTQEPLFEVVAPLFAVPVGRPGRPWGLWGVRRHSIERNRRGVLMEPGCRHGVDLQRFERAGAQHLLEIGRKQRIEEVS